MLKHPGFWSGTSWKHGVMTGGIIATLVCLTNIIVLTWAVLKHGFPKDGTGVLYQGSCSTMRSINIGVHLFINASSAVLLSASNYTMQCLSAPTRSEIDEAHRKQTWLDIGILSLRNLKHINSRRCLLWACLCITSWPLHLFYNSTIFSSVAAVQYYAVEARPAFFNATTSDQAMENVVDSSARDIVSSLFIGLKAGTLESLNEDDCRRTYDISFQTSYGNFIMNASDTNFDPNSLSTPCISDKICRIRIIPMGTRTSDQLSRDLGSCLVQKIEENCSIRFNFPVAIIVTIFNATKVFLLWTVALRTHTIPLLTIGDAVSSFIEHHDATTINMCLMSSDDFDGDRSVWTNGFGPRFYVAKRRRWSQAATKKQWLSCIILCGLAILICLSLSMACLGRNIFVGPWNIGFGSPDTRTFIKWQLPKTGSSALLGNSFIINLPQVALSFLYLAFNTTMTSLLLGNEWHSYAKKRKGLRVSAAPEGEQRSTYFLQLPYRYSVPLIFASGAIHWLVSQSMYLVSITAFKATGERLVGSKSLYTAIPNSSDDITTAGYSPIGILLVLCCVSVFLATVLLLGRRRFPEGLSVAGSCSAAMSAACHLQHSEVQNPQHSPLQWGVTSEPDAYIGHCTFSPMDVRKPEPFSQYAGDLQKVEMTKKESR